MTPSGPCSSRCRDPLVPLTVCVCVCVFLPLPLSHLLPLSLPLLCSHLTLTVSVCMCVYSYWVLYRFCTGSGVSAEAALPTFLSPSPLV